MLLECSCGKMFRVRDGAQAAPTKCPSCGGVLRPAAISAAAPTPAVPMTAMPAADPRVRQLEAKVAELERSAATAKAASSKEIEDLASRLAQAQKAREEAAAEGARLKGDLQKREGEGGTRLRTLEKELQEARVRGQQAGLAAIKEKDAELHYAQERIAALERELQDAQSGGGGGGALKDRVAQLEKELADSRGAADRAALKAKEDEHKESQEAIARLGEELKKAQDVYKTTLANKEKELEELHEKTTGLEMQVAESAARAQGGGKLNALLDQKNHDLARAQQRITMLEKIVQDGEQRYRALQEELQKTSDGAHSTTAADSRALDQKERANEELRAALSNQKAQADGLRRQLEAAKAENESLAARAKTQGAGAGGGRVVEVRGLAGDLDRSLGGVSDSLQGIVELVKRLNEKLQESENAAAPAEDAGTLESETPAPAADAPAEEAETAPAALEGEAAVDLESLPEGAAISDEEGGLPQDETLLDLGGAGMGKKVRQALQARQAAKAPAPDEEPAEEAKFEEAPLDPDAAPAPDSEEQAPVEPEAEAPSEQDADKPKKKGLFGKLFGRKK